MAKGIFIKILPSLDAGAVGAAINALQNAFSKAGRDIESSFKGPQKALKALQDQAIQATNAATAASIKADKAAADAAINKARYEKTAQEASLKAVEERTAAELRAISALDIAYKKKAAAQTVADQRQAAAAEAAAAHTAAQAELGAAVSNTGRALNVVGVGALGAFGYALDKTSKSASDFERTQVRLATSAGESYDKLGQVSQGILDMAGGVGVTAQELSRGMYTVESAGFHGAEGLQVLKAAAQGFSIEGGDLKDVTNAVTTSLHDYHMNADQAANVTSKMIAAVSHGKTTFGDFTASLHTVEPAAAAVGISMNDLFSTLATMTVSGESAEQAAQHMNDAINHLSVPTSQMREELAQMGIDARDLQTNLEQDGLGGTMLKLSNAIQEHMTPAGRAAISAFNQQKVMAEDARVAYEKLTPAAQAVADKIKNGTLSYAQWRKTAGGVSALDRGQLDQWFSLEKRVTGFSQAIKNGSPQLQTWLQAMKLMVGDMPSLDVALMLSGKNAQYYSDTLKDVSKATTEANGDVKGMSEVQQTAAQKWNELKATLSSLGVEIGNSFLPAMKDVADSLKGVVHIFAEHPALAKTVVDALGLMGAAWLLLKAKMAMDAVFLAISTGFATVTRASATTAAAITADAAIEKTAIAGVTAATVEEGVATEAVATKSAATATTVEASAARQTTAIGGVTSKLSGLIGVLGEVGLAWMAADMAAKPLEEWMDKHSSEYHNSREPAKDGGNLFTEGAFFGLFGPSTGDGGQSQGESHPGLAPKDPRSAVDRLLNPGGGESYGLLGLQPSQQNGAALSEPLPDWVKNSGIAGLIGAAQNVPKNLLRDEPNPISGLEGNLEPPPAKKTKGGKGTKGDTGIPINMPDGTRNDPLYISPADVGVGGGLGRGDSHDGSSPDYNPFQMSGGLTLPNLARLATTFLGELALGNPYGKLHARGAGQAVDLSQEAAQLDAMSPQQREELQATLKMQKAITDYQERLRKYGEAVSKYGENSKQALDAQSSLVNARVHMDNVGSSGLSAGAGSSYTPSGLGTDASQDQIASLIIQAGQARGMSPSVIKAALESGFVESGMRNLNYGDRDSLGVFQERPSQGWGTPAQIMDPAYSIKQWYDHAQGVPGFQSMDSGALAQSVERSAFPAKYGQQSSRAEALYNRLTAGGGGAPMGPEQGPGIPGNPGTPLGPLGGGGSGGIGGGRATPGSGMGAPSPLSGLGTSPQSQQSQSRQPGTENSGKGFGVGGGAIGMAESAAAMAANAFAPGSGEAVQMGEQLLNRAIGYGGQLAGIGVEGILETFGLNDSAISDPSKSLFGKVALGFAGAHPTAQNVAGQSAPPLKDDDKGGDKQQGDQQQGNAPLVNIEHQQIDNGNGGEAARDTARQFMSLGSR